LTADSIRAESSGGTTGRAGDPGPAARESATGPIPADLEPSDLPRGPGMSPEERGAQSRENPPDPTDPGTLPTSTRKGPQPALEPAAADARKVDAAAPETVMAQGAGKASGPDDAGRHAEPPLRVQAGSWPPSTEAKPGDPAHTPAEFKGAFDASGKTAYLKIQDQGLGAMQWHLRMEGGRLAAEAVVQSARIQEVFHANQDVLQARLNELGVELEGFEVSVDQGSQGFLGRGLHKGAVPEVQGRGQDANPGTFIERVQANVTARARGGVDLYA
jgi:flagellar hook-length control protein FliK